MAFDQRACSLRGCESRGSDRVHVADGKVDAQPEGEGVVEARVGGDHVGIRRQGAGGIG
jgi:hypothetical protein